REHEQGAGAGDPGGEDQAAAGGGAGDDGWGPGRRGAGRAWRRPRRAVAMIARRPDPQELALEIFEDSSRLLAAAKRLTAAGLGPVVGGIAVFLHGYRRTTEDVDLYCDDTVAATQALEALG